ncbi:MAG: LVIVD repeat-containing protein [Ginsengibacter sp.]
MKKIIPLFFALPVFSVLFLLNSCVKDTCRNTYNYTIYKPVYETTAQLKANIKSGAPEQVENAGKIVLLRQFIFLNEVEKGIHIIDNSNPAAPQNIAFVKIPGNFDLAVKGNTLYVDSYADLVTLDISDPRNVVLKKYSENVFPFPYYSSAIAYNPQYKIASWDKKDTTINENCGDDRLVYFDGRLAYQTNGVASSVPSANSSQVGTAGSMSRFAIISDYLYTVDEANLNIFKISTPYDPEYVKQLPVDFHIETIYPFENKLFIGSNNGVFIYGVGGFPENPVKLGQFTHARACDPVITDGEYAYITLHSGTNCLGYNNELDIVRLNMLVNASLVQMYNFESPRGLSKDGDLLFICDGNNGLKVFDATDVLNLKLLKHISLTETYDVIAKNHVALVVAADGLYQYDYSDPNNIHFLSKVSISKKQ